MILLTCKLFIELLYFKISLFKKAMKITAFKNFRSDSSRVSYFFQSACIKLNSNRILLQRLAVGSDSVSAHAM